MRSNVADIDSYIAGYPKKVQLLLKQMRATIRKAAPKAEEAIKYGMPSFVQNGVLVYFAGCQNHIGFYAAPTAHEAFKKEFSVYKTGKGSVQFPIDQKLPLDLVTRVVKFRLKLNEEKAAKKNALKKSVKKR